MKLTRLREWRESRGLMQQEVAAMAEVAPRTVLRAEHGESVQPPTARKIAAVLGVSVADLMESPPVPLAQAPQSGPQEVSFPLDIDQIRREVAGDDWANTWSTQALKTAVEGEIERRYTDPERFEFKRQFGELIDRLAPQKETRLDEYMKAVEGYGYVSRVLERVADKELA